MYPDFARDDKGTGMPSTTITFMLFIFFRFFKLFFKVGPCFFSPLMQNLLKCIVARTVLGMPVPPVWECVDAMERGLLVWENSIAQYFELELASLTSVLWADPVKWHRYMEIIIRHEEAFTPSIDASFDSGIFDDCLGESMVCFENDLEFARVESDADRGESAVEAPPLTLASNAQKKKFFCLFPGCRKIYASSDGVRKHARQSHSEWAARHRGDVRAVCGACACE